MPEAWSRPAWAEIDVGAVRDNTAALVDAVAPAQVCAVVKADGYGHGAVPVARAALRGGATWLGVAVLEEGVALREAGIDAPVLLLTEPPVEAMATAAEYDLVATVYTAAGIAASKGPVHLKVDTGMHRVGCHVDDAVALAGAAGDRLQGLWTHLAVADEPGRAEFTATQLQRFETVRAAISRVGLDAELVHAANSAGALAYPEARYNLVRCGIALYGYAPAADFASPVILRPALALKARVTQVRQVPAGDALSYGLRYQMRSAGTVATVPLGYADGVTRRLGATGASVLIGGRRCPVAGTVTMDQLMVDCGPDAVASVGDEVVLIGRQGDQVITADEWAARLGTISYEVLCGIGPRVPRVYV